MGFLDTLKETYDEANKSYVPSPLELIQKGAEALQTSPEEIKARTERAMARANGLPVPVEVPTAPVVPTQPAVQIAQTAPISVAPVSIAPSAQATVSPSDVYKKAFEQGSKIAAAMPSTGLGMQMAAAKKTGEIGEQAGLEQSRIYEEQQKTLQDQADKMASRQAIKQAEMADFDKKYQEIEKEDEGKVDFNRYFKNQTTGNKILSGLSLALSVFGGAGSTGKVIGIIDDAVNKDIEAQKFDVAQKGAKKAQKLKSMDNMYARMLDKYGDADKADAATRSILIDKTMAQINALSARTNSQTAKAQAQNLIGELQGKKDAIATQLGLSLGQAAATSMPSAGQELPDNWSPKTKEQTENWVPGIGLAVSTEEAKNIRTQMSSYNKLNDSVQQMIELRKKFGSETLPTEAKGKMDLLAGKALLAMKDAAKLGVMSETDFKLLNNIIVNPSGYNPNTMSRLEALHQAANNDFIRDIQPRLLNPVKSLSVKKKLGEY